MRVCAVVLRHAPEVVVQEFGDVVLGLDDAELTQARGPAVVLALPEIEQCFDSQFPAYGIEMRKATIVLSSCVCPGVFFSSVLQAVEHLAVSLATVHIPALHIKSHVIESQRRHDTVKVVGSYPVVIVHKAGVLSGGLVELMIAVGSECKTWIVLRDEKSNGMIADLPFEFGQELC